MQSSPLKAPDYANLPLAFVANGGQRKPAVRFETHALGGTIAFMEREVALVLPSLAKRDRHEQPPRQKAKRFAPVRVRLRFEGANTASSIVPVEPLAGKVNYVLGDAPAPRRKQLRTYGGIVYQQLYAGIDLRYDGAHGHLKSTYTVAPGADPTSIRWRYSGQSNPQVDAAGNLVITVARGSGKPTEETPPTLVESPPLAWQTIDGRRVEVRAAYRVAANGTVSFDLGAYDPTKPLTIDPTLTTSYVEGSLDDIGYGIAVDSAGAVYLTGETASSDFDTFDPAQPHFGGGNYDAFVTKLDRDGSTILYSTYLGGAGDDHGKAIAVDGDGFAYITGSTSSSNFPRKNPRQNTFGGSQDAFVTKLNQDGSELTYSTYLGSAGGESGAGIAVDGTGKAIVTGGSDSADMLPGAVRPFATGCPDVACTDAFVVQLNASGTNLTYSTYIGGSHNDQGAAVAVDSAGNAYITGTTYSANFPLIAGLGRSHGGLYDAFVAKVDTVGGLGYSSYLGGNDEDFGYGIAVDSTGNAYVTGVSYSSASSFPSASATSGSRRGWSDAFAVKLNAAGSGLSYRAFLGGSEDDLGYGIAVDQYGHASITGYTDSSDFLPLQNPKQAIYGGNTDAFVTTLNSAGSATFGTYLGGSGVEMGRAIAVDSAGTLFVAGHRYTGDGDAFVMRIGEPLPLQVKITDAQGNPVRELALNDDGWPAVNAATGTQANPITVTVQLFNPGTVANDFTLDVTFNPQDSTINPARFYIYSVPSSLVQPDNNIFSYTEYRISSRITLTAGESRTLTWGVWMQPSNAGVFGASIQLRDFPGNVLVGTDVESVSVPGAAIHPIVFIPGLSATIPPAFDGSLDIAGKSIGGNYNHFYNSLYKMGYEKDKTFFQFPYDWLISTIRTAGYLNSRLITWADVAAQVPWVAGAGSPNTIRFDLVGHSTGNLVTRAYVQGPHWGRDNVRKWVSIAGPLQGLPKGYAALEGSKPELGAIEHNIPLMFEGLNVWIYQRAQRAGYTTKILGFDRLTTRGEYLFVHDPVDGMTILPEFLPTYGDYLFGAAGTPHPYGRLANTLLEPASVVNGSIADVKKVRDGIDAQAMQGKVYDPYTDNPWVAETDFLRKPLPAGFQTTYEGLNTPAEMQELEARVGAANTCIVYGGADLGAGSNDTVDGFEVITPGIYAPHWLNGRRQEEQQGLGDELIPEVSADLDGIWAIDVPPRNRFELEEQSERHLKHRSIVGEDIAISATAQCLTELHPTFLTEKANRGGSATTSTTSTTSATTPSNLMNQAEATATTETNTPVRSLLLYAPGPVELLLTDTQGRRAGYDPTSGVVLKEIPDTIYKRDTVAQEATLFVYLVEPGAYTVTITGAGAGAYEVLAWYEDDHAVAELPYKEGTITSGQTSIMSLDLPATTAEVPNLPNVQAGRDTSVEVGQSVTLKGAFTDINTGDTHTITWSFGDGTSTSGALSTAHSYASVGVYTATLTITDSSGFTVSDTLNVTVNAATSGGTRLKNITFEGGSLTDPTTGVDNTFGTVNLETSAPIAGSYAARIPNAGESYLREDFSAVADLYVSFYVRLNALPSSSIQFVTLTDTANGTVGNLQLRSTGRLRLRVGANTIGSDSVVLQPGTLYRIGLRQKQGTGGNAVLEAYLAEGSASFGAPFASTNTGAWTTATTRFRIGPTAQTLMDFVVDDIRLDTAAMPQP